MTLAFDSVDLVLLTLDLVDIVVVDLVACFVTSAYDLVNLAFDSVGLVLLTLDLVDIVNDSVVLVSAFLLLI